PRVSPALPQARTRHGARRTDRSSRVLEAPCVLPHAGGTAPSDPEFTPLHTAELDGMIQAQVHLGKVCGCPSCARSAAPSILMLRRSAGFAATRCSSLRQLHPHCHAGPRSWCPPEAQGSSHGSWAASLRSCCWH